VDTVDFEELVEGIEAHPLALFSFEKTSKHLVLVLLVDEVHADCVEVLLELVPTKGVPLVRIEQTKHVVQLAFELRVDQTFLRIKFH
jgi:hypothetical protein